MIRDVVDFPSEGITFKDITPILGHGPSFGAAIGALAAPWEDKNVAKVLGIEARGFLLGAPVADRLGAGFVPVRKPGKLPVEVLGADYVLEYGTDRLEVHRDSVAPGERVVIIDDVLATGGTAAAAVRLASALGAELVGLGFFLEIEALRGRDRLEGQVLATVVRC